MKKLLLIGLFLCGISNLAFAFAHDDIVNGKKSTYLATDELETMPEFPGGMEGLQKYLVKNLQYPKKAREDSIQGRVIVKFIVQKDGSIANIEIESSPHETLSKEAIRVIELMPKWKPGRLKGEPVRVQYVLPVTFKLE